MAALRTTRPTKIDWPAVQAYYEAGHTVRECAAHFGFCTASWTKAVRAGRVVGRPRTRKPPEEARARKAAYHRRYFAGYYRRNLEAMVAKARDRKRELTAFLEELRGRTPCAECGQSHPAIIEFHHTDPTGKDFNISEAINRGMGLKRILAEIEKCIPMCANCHRKLHWNERHPAPSGVV